MPRRPLTTLLGLGPAPPVVLPMRPRCALPTLRGLGAHPAWSVVDDHRERTIPIPLVRPYGTVAVRRDLVAVMPHGPGAPSLETTFDGDEDPRRQTRMGRARRFGTPAILAVAVLALAELVYLLLA
jgi:hypothetical protein